jgi:hypothetical protein
LPTQIINDAKNNRTPPKIVLPSTSKRGRKPHTAEQKSASKLAAQEKKLTKRARVNEINDEDS